MTPGTFSLLALPVIMTTAISGLADLIRQHSRPSIVGHDYIHADDVRLRSHLLDGVAAPWRLPATTS